LGTIVNNAKSFYRKCIRAFEHENVIPFITDQPLNQKRIEELQLGKKLEYKKLQVKG